MNGQWINVNDRLPEIGATVLIYNADPGKHDVRWAVAEYDGEWQMELPWEFTIIEAPTHWMPLPISPEAT